MKIRTNEQAQRSETPIKILTVGELEGLLQDGTVSIETKTRRSVLLKLIDGEIWIDLGGGNAQRALGADRNSSDQLRFYENGKVIRIDEKGVERVLTAHKEDFRAMLSRYAAG